MSAHVSVIGCGYLGAVHAAAMASLGHRTVGIEIDSRRVEMLNDGEIPFYEPQLAELVRAGIASGLLHFTTDYSVARDAATHFLAVGTPRRAEDDAADLSQLEAAVNELLPHLNDGDLVVGKSTVPVGTASALAGTFAEYGTALIWNPEFLREGFAVRDTLEPDRIVYGTDDAQKGVDQLDNIYADILRNGMPKLITSYPTAELIKVSANSFLATKISFINAVSELADAAGADVTQIADAIGMDKRIGRQFLNAGIGFGGGCLPKDVRAFRASARQLGLSALDLLDDVLAVNDRARTRMVNLIERLVGGDLSGRRIAALGLAFKPNSDDIRESASIRVVQELLARGAEVCAFDPHAGKNARRVLPEESIVDSLEQAIAGADAVVVLTEWQQFTALDPRALDREVRSKVIVDGRSCLDAGVWRGAGWRYGALGRP